MQYRKPSHVNLAARISPHARTHSVAVSSGMFASDRDRLIYPHIINFIQLGSVVLRSVVQSCPSFPFPSVVAMMVETWLRRKSHSPRSERVRLYWWRYGFPQLKILPSVQSPFRRCRRRRDSFKVLWSNQRNATSFPSFVGNSLLWVLARRLWRYKKEGGESLPSN